MVHPNKLRRVDEGRSIAGVCRGMSAHIGFGTTLVRAIFIALALKGGLGIVVYAVLWVTVPLQSVGEERRIPAALEGALATEPTYGRPTKTDGVAAHERSITPGGVDS